MALIEIKQGLGTVVRTKKPLVLYHIVVDGKKVATCGTPTEARNYCERRYGFVPTVQMILDDWR